MKIPYFPFYPDDWLSSSRIDTLTAEQERGYLRLLCRSWGMPDCTLTTDEAHLLKWSLLSDADALRTLMQTFFERTCKGWRNPKLYSLWIKAQEKHLKASKNANSRWNKEKQSCGRICDGNANQNQNQNQKKREAGKIENPARNPEAIASEKAEEALLQVAAQVEGHRTGARLAINDPIAVKVILEDLGGKDPALKLPPEEFRALFVQHYARRELEAFASRGG